MNAKIENLKGSINEIEIDTDGPAYITVRVDNGVLLVDVYEADRDTSPPVAVYNSEVEAAAREAEDFQRDPMDMYPD